MNVKLFSLLAEDAQAALVWKGGVLLDVLIKDPYRILLYQLNNFYVEVHYNYERGVIEAFVSFEGMDQLDTYLTRIDLDPIFRTQPGNQF